LFSLKIGKHGRPEIKDLSLFQIFERSFQIKCTEKSKFQKQFFLGTWYFFYNNFLGLSGFGVHFFLNFFHFITSGYFDTPVDQYQKKKHLTNLKDTVAQDFQPLVFS
jgi:hypothetical protein